MGHGYPMIFSRENENLCDPPIAEMINNNEKHAMIGTEKKTTY